MKGKQIVKQGEHEVKTQEKENTRKTKRWGLEMGKTCGCEIARRHNH